MIVLMAGLPGAGKTTLARELARRTGGAVLGKDEIRAALFAPEDIEYSAGQDDFVMNLMFETARYLLQKNSSRIVLLDGRPFSQRYQIDRVLELARELAQPWTIIECVCSDESVRRRLEIAAGPSHPAQNRSYALHLEVKGRFEPIIHSKITIDTDQPLDRCIEQALAILAPAWLL